jgi:exodeoxyribonuclease V beta subunit
MSQPMASDSVPLALSLPLDDRAWLIEADAGSGKTWTLSALAMRLLLERNLAPEHLLVVTFTRNAAAELKQRIRQRLRAIEHLIADHLVANPPRTVDTDPLLARYLQHLEERFELRQVHAHLRVCLAGLDRLQVQTIHGFCQQTLQQWAAVIGLPTPLGIDTQGDVSLQATFSHWWDKLLDELDADQQIGLANLGLPVKRIFSRVSRRLDLPLAPLQPQAWPHWRDALGEWRGGRNNEEIEAVLQGELDAVCDRLKKSHPETFGVSASKYRDSTLRKIVASIHDICRGLTAAFPEAEDLGLWTLEGLVAAGARPESLARFEFWQIVDGVLNWLMQRDHMLAGLVETAARQMQEGLRQGQSSSGVLRYSDQVEWLLHALSHGSQGAVIARGVSQQYQAMLIDECQDTDARQWAILGALFGGASRAPIVMVGDPKQAVYRFRGADVQAYIQVRERGLLDLEGRARKLERCTLNSNQRSTPAVIDSVNRLLARQPVWLDPGLEYAGAIRGAKPLPVLHDVAWPPSPGDPGTLGIVLPEKGSVPEIEDAILDAIVAETRRMLDPMQVRIDGRAVKPGEIAVLVNSHSQAATVVRRFNSVGMACALQRFDKSLFGELATLDFEIVLQAIDDPLNAARRRAAALLLGWADDADFLNQLQDFCLHWPRLCFGLASWLDTAPRRGLAAADGDGAAYGGDHGEIWRELHQQMLSAAQACTSPREALRWLQRKRAEGQGQDQDERVMPDAQEAIQVMTSFAAKGLEFAFVFLPFFWRPRKADSNAELVSQGLGEPSALDVAAYRQGNAKTALVSAKLADAVRQFYVAITRAVLRTVLFIRPGEVIGHLMKHRVSPLGSESPALPIVKQEVTINDWLRQLEPWSVTTLSPNNTSSYTGNVSSSANRVSLVTALSASRPPAVWPSSFTSIMRQRPEPGAGDIDKRLEEVERSIDRPDDRPLEQAQRKPLPKVRVEGARGLAFGIQLHELLAKEDFHAPLSEAALQRWVIAAGSVEHPGQAQSDESVPLTTQYQIWWDELRHWPLTVSAQACLAQWPAQRIAREWPFSIRVRRSSLEAVAAMLKPLGLSQPDLARLRVPEGVLRGSIDLVLQDDEGRFHLLDWKSNFLGRDVEDYLPKALDQAMGEAGYHLQHVLYALALHRWLGKVKPDYQPREHLGEVHFLFLRGLMRAGPHHSGHWHRPIDVALVEAMDRLLQHDRELDHG